MKVQMALQPLKWAITTETGKNLKSANCCDLKHREFTFYLCSWYKTNL